MADVEDQVRDFYDEQGWQEDSTAGKATYADAQLWEDLRPCAVAYVSACRRKVLEFLPAQGERILDAGSGPIQYPEYLEYSAGFAKRVCVDLSERALAEARNKLGDRGDYVRASLLELPFPDGHFDAAVSLHTIYHIDADRQETAVRELIRVLRPGTSAVVVYANPDRLAARLKRFAGRRTDPNGGPIYFFAHPLSWWERFSDEATVEVVPWRSLNANESRRLIPDNALGAGIFRAFLAFERTVPSLA
ncbi:MAG TPA: class I SAM-dependent methyltransferase, partial [Acidimicrobiales bacterium]|nr:class I SAM-dependent methyltransferase [Acidimicrobiales bacterium]